MPDGVDDRELDPTRIDGEVEGIATDRVRRLEDPAHRHDVGRTRRRRQEVPLHLGRERERLGAAAAQDGVGEPALADQHEYEHANDRVERGLHVGRPVRVPELQDTEAFALIFEGHADERRVVGREHDLVAHERASGQRSVDRLVRTGRTVDPQLLEGDERVVGDQHPRRARPERGGP